MSVPLRRTAYFNVPPSQRSLRVRATPRAEPKVVRRESPLDQLIVGHLFHPLAPGRAFPDEDWLEAMDATYEDANGLLSHQAGYVDPALTRKSSDLEDLPDWLAADAHALAAGGMTLRKIATAILPESGCPDLPSCEEALARALDLRAGDPGVGSQP